MLRLSEQCLSIVLFIEQKVKNTVLYKLFSFNNVRWGCCDKFANLQLDNITINSDQSIWFADSDFFTQITLTCNTALCHKSTVYSAQWASLSKYSMFDILHAHVFFLFMNVIYIFADDFNSLENIAKTVDCMSIHW